MPVSPQDYALWSRMTGNPIPTSPAERMAVAPQVYDFSRNLGRRTEKSGLRKAVDVIGKAALAAGAVAGAAALASKFGGKDDGGFEEVEIKDVTEPSESTRVSPKGFLSSAISGLGDEGPGEPDAPTPTPGGEPEDVVKVTQIEMPSKGVSSEDIVQAVQTAKSRTAAERQASRLTDAPDFGDTREILPKDLDLYAEHTQAMHRRGVSERAQQFLNRLGLDDEVAVDNDIIAANPGSNTALASQDVTSADPASAIGQRISSNQTGAAVAERSAAAPKQTVASKLSQQQSVVHLDEADTELVGAPAAGAIEAFKKGRQYQEMKQRYQGLQDIASPSTEGVSSSSILPSAPTQATVGERLRSAGYGRQGVPVALGGEGVELYSEGLEKGIGLNTPAGLAALERAGVTPEEAEQSWVKQLRESGALPAAAVKVSAPRRTAEQDEQELLMRKYAGLAPKAQPAAAPAVVTEEVEVVKPAAVAPVAFLKEKAATVRPQATQRGTVEHAVAEAMEQREGMRQPPEGTQVFELPKGGTRQVKLYPSQQVGVVYANDPHTEYSYKSSPEYYGELEGMLKKGEFVPGGTGFIQAGRNLGYLY